MSTRTGPTNAELQELIHGLKKQSAVHKVSLWKRVATDLEKPTRRRRVVNLSRINRFTEDGETIVIPGKVLGAGDLQRKLRIAAYQFSTDAKEKILASGSTIITLEELAKESPKGKKIRIIG
ncbi:TPA: 50S ribosomal protein L18e [Candidatus Woesearchaeota archaeon]|nr:50S ribosomal protein L18e [Candidatus Woesearchaeota archaeon]HII69148.1 50S ribosomal protein L18e [Candidatus Woesearchaeota archaeon]